MALKKVDRSELGATLTVVAKISKIEETTFAKGGYESPMMHMRLTWSNSSVFVYEKEHAMIQKLRKLNEGDVIFVSGEFEAKWWKGQKNSIPVIAKITEFKKMGVIK